MKKLLLFFIVFISSLFIGKANACTVSPATVTICQSGNTTLSGSPAAGTFSSSNTAVATVGLSSGVVYGVSSGSALITYTISGCSSICTVNVLSTTAPMRLAPTAICDSFYFDDITVGGVWSSSNTAIATVEDISVVGSGISTAKVFAASCGSVTISYTTVCGTVTANTDLAITPVIISRISSPPNPCVGASTTLSLVMGSTEGGTLSYTWFADPFCPTCTSVTLPAPFPARYSGVIVYNNYGSANCYVYDSIYINTIPTPVISGPNTACVGTTNPPLSVDTVDGTWSSSNTAVATIDGSGDVGGVSVGTAIITYTSVNGCIGIYNVAVSVPPVPITTGVGTTICVGNATVFFDATPGGVWSSSNASIASVDASGIVYGLSAGIATISYTNACGYSTLDVDVVPSCVCTLPVTPYVELSGTISPATLSGYYIINTAIVITGAVNFANSIIVMGPGATIVVNGPAAKLTISGSHLFSCYPNMWKGIVLTGGISGTGQLEVTQNSLIEDAEVAVAIAAPFAPTYSPGDPASSLILYTHDAIFNKNTIGVQISNYTAFYTPGALTDFDPQYPFEMENTVFTSRKFNGYTSPSSGLMWPYAWPANTGTPDALKTFAPPATPYDPPYNLDILYGQTPCNNGSIPLYGIDLENVGATTGTLAGAQYCGFVIGGAYPAADADLNLFDNMNYGIYAHNSNLVCRNTGFMHMMIPKGTGEGIYAYRDATAAASDNLYKLDVFGSGPDYYDQFWDCGNCVEASDLYDVIGSYAVMNSNHSIANFSDFQGQYGYKISSTEFYNIQINFNNIYNIYTAVSVAISHPSGWRGAIGQVTIDNNNISATNTGGTPTLGEYVNQGVFMQNLASGSGSATTISTSEINIDNNQLTGVYNGVYMHGCNSAYQEATTVNNNISIVPDVRKPILQTGIEHISTINGYIYNNFVSGAGYNVPTPPSASGGLYLSSQTIEGIHVSDAQKQWVDCNTVSDINSGIYIGGTNVTLYFLDNTMQYNAYGFVLDGHIMTGSYPTYGNQWQPASFWAGTNWQTYTVGAPPSFFPLYVYGPGGTQDPTNNGGESGVYSVPLTIIESSDANAVCGVPDPTSVAPEMRQSNPTVVPITATNTGTKLIVYPNPNNATFNLTGTLPAMSSSGYVNIEITDLLGKVIYSGSAPIENGAINKNISLGDKIADGIYLIKATNNQTNQVIRFNVLH